MIAEMILKIIGLVCSTVIAVAVLLTNKEDEYVATKVMIFMGVVVTIIFPEIWRPLL